MAMRLLISTAIGLALGTAAFAQMAADPSKTESNTPPAAQSAPANAAAPAATAATQPTVTLSAGVSVTEPDRNRISESVGRMSVKPLRGVDFSVAVGSRVPRELRVYRLPAEVVQIVPQYRDYRFLVVDKEILIVEPSASNRIVTILPRDPAITTAKAPAATPAVTPAPAVAAAVPAAPAPTAAAPVAVAPATPAPATAAVTSPAPAPTTSTTATATPTTATPSASAPSTPTMSAPAAAASAAVTPDQPPAPTAQTTAEPDRAKAKKQASRAQRLSRARDEARRARADVRVGQRVPDDVVLYEMPPRMYREAPIAREYRYRSYATGSRGRTIYQEYD